MNIDSQQIEQQLKIPTDHVILLQNLRRITGIRNLVFSERFKEILIPDMSDGSYISIDNFVFLPYDGDFEKDIQIPESHSPISKNSIIREFIKSIRFEDKKVTIFYNYELGLWQDLDDNIYMVDDTGEFIRIRNRETFIMNGEAFIVHRIEDYFFLFRKVNGQAQTPQFIFDNGDWIKVKAKIFLEEDPEVKAKIQSLVEYNLTQYLLGSNSTK